MPLGEPTAGGPLTIIASIEEPQLIAKILSHLERTAPEQYQSELPENGRVGGLRAARHAQGRPSVNRRGPWADLVRTGGLKF